MSQRLADVCDYDTGKQARQAHYCDSCPFRDYLVCLEAKVAQESDVLCPHGFFSEGCGDCRDSAQNDHW